MSDRRRRLLRFLSRISIRLLAFNVLLVFLPVFGILSLKTYEEQLLDLQERSMVQQGRILAAALGGRDRLDVEEAERVLSNMQQQFAARLRVVDDGANIVADSSRFGPRLETVPGAPASAEQAAAEAAEAAVREKPLYRLGSFLYQGVRGMLGPPQAPTGEGEPPENAYRLANREVADALAGRYGKAIRPTGGQRSLTLYSALPIRSGDRVVGAVVVSKSTFQILTSLYDLRLRTFTVVLASVAMAVVLSLLLSTTIARPISRLRDEANEMLDRRGRLKRPFQGSQRLDEIGDLSRALAELTRRLEDHIHFIESFASDVSHEFKNPLASIRNATELLAEVDDPADRERFFAMVERDIARLEHLLSGVREITRIDAHLEEQSVGPIDLRPLLEALIERFELRNGKRLRYQLVAEPDTPPVLASPDRLAQVFENLLDNAATFSPPEGEIRLELERADGQVVVRVADQGQGIPEEHLDKIFHRFFTYRPHTTNGKGDHTGLGLSIVRAIVEGYGGAVTADNRDAGGAVLEVRLPAVGR